MIEVVAVTDPARQARLVRSLSAAFSAAGLRLRQRTHHELVAEVSIEQPLGQGPVVDPDRPLLWLSPAHMDQPATADGRFLVSETLAAARSIATLTNGPVLNRPSAVGPCGTLPAGRPLAVRRARRIGGLEAAIRAERFTGGWLSDDDPGSGRLEVLDYATGRSSYGPAPSLAGPFRRRPAIDRAALVRVRVIGDRTLTGADVTPATLTASVRIAAWYELDLAAVWWLIRRDNGERTLARIDCWAWDAELGTEVDQVAAMTAAWMGDRLEQPAGVRR
jgi:hypothetical protein